VSLWQSDYTKYFLATLFSHTIKNGGEWIFSMVGPKLKNENVLMINPNNLISPVQKKIKTLMKKYLAETIGTFALVFAGTGAIVINQMTGGVISHVGIAATFGLVIGIMIFAVGDVSGAHFNPAVTLGFFVAGKLPGKEVGPYVAAQIVGAFLASFVIKFLFFYTIGPHNPDITHLGTTLPAGSDRQSWVLEFILTFFLMFVIVNVATGSKEVGMFAGIAIGGTILLDAMFGGPISGASMNPARSLAPAVVSGHYEHLWLYLTAPFAGAITATMAWKIIKGN
jgi:aquaporin Z